MNIIGIILILVFSVFCILLFGVLIYLKKMWTIWATLRDAFNEVPKMENMKELFKFIENKYRNEKDE